MDLIKDSTKIGVLLPISFGSKVKLDKKRDVLLNRVNF